MVSTMKEKYEELKKYRNVLLNYDEILLFYPDYYKTKVELENEKFILKEEIDKIFEENYKESKLYKKLVDLAMADDEIYLYMKNNKDLKYTCLKNMFEKYLESSINLCELIDYIGHYPTTYPVPLEDEKNPKMEELLEKYDIIVRYYLGGDDNDMRITSDDVVRIVEKLEKNLSLIDPIKDKIKKNDWIFTRKMSDEKRIEITNNIIEYIESFPLSIHQERGESRREMGKMYLRRQHGKNII